ncbi:MAG: hypothetical protein RIQ53_3257 [Pseudomonadota bacterium]
MTVLPDALPALEAPLDPHRPEPLQRQLCQRVRDGVAAGWLPPGLRLPATRVLAQVLGVSRNTVSLAYEQLLAEGWLQADRRGTVVARLGPWGAGARAATPIPAGEPAVRAVATEAAPPRLARRLATLPVHPTLPSELTALRPGIPALGQFPHVAWRQAMDRAQRTSSALDLNYGDVQGLPALRAAIAAHLAVSRGVHCTPAQVVITEGAQEALSLCVRLLTDPGDTAWMEEPGYRGARAALLAGDLRVLPRRVDAEGLSWTEDDWREAPPRLIYTSPSHQYPMGAVLSVARRLALMQAAQAHDAWIIEDDYDSEFRLAGAPIAAMQGLRPDAPVLYVGTFSKTLFPALRLGFLVLPQRLLPAVMAPLREWLRGGPLQTQRALAHFIASGQFSRHLARMRRLYRSRHQALGAALARHLGDLPHRIEGGRCGLHLCLRLPAGFPDLEAAAAAAAEGVAPHALSAFAMAPRPEDRGLVLGYGNTPEEAMDGHVRILARGVRSCLLSPRLLTRRKT